MRSIWQNLAWKEWHEHKWKLAALSGILCGMTAVVLVAVYNEPHFTLDGFMAALLMGMIPLTIFIGAGEAAGESARRTMPFLQALPVPMWKAAAWKLVFGTITCLLPVLFTILLISAWYFCAAWWGGNPHTKLWYGELGLREFAGFKSPLLAWAVCLLVVVGTMAVSVLVWTTALGVNRKSEVAVGALALLAVAVWWTTFTIVANGTDPEEFLKQTLLISALSMGPGGPLFVLGSVAGLPSFQLAWAVVAAAVAHLALISWYVSRFGRSENVGTYSPQTAKRTLQLEWLGVPRRSPFSAIIWKQCRESGPIVLAGLAAILSIPVLFILANAGSHKNFSGQDFALFILVLTGYIGFLVVLIVGIGMFDHDLSPKLHSFWRSRPIDPNLWYWTKYLTGLVILVVALLFPVAIAGFLLWAGHPRGGPPFRFEPLVIAICVYWAFYALASSTICLVRMVIYAAILSMGVLAGGTGLLWILLDVNDSQWTVADWITTVTVTALTTAALATLVGWWAVRRDIGWKK